MATGTSPLIASAPTIPGPKSLVYVQNTALVDNSSFLDQIGQEMANRAIKDDLKEWVQVTYPEIADLLIELISCESGFNTLAKGDNSTSFGLLQFKQTTWQENCEGDIWNGQDQISCAVKMIDMGLGDTTTGWYNCWRRMNLDKYL